MLNNRPGLIDISCRAALFLIFLYVPFLPFLHFGWSGANTEPLVLDEVRLCYLVLPASAFLALVFSFQEKTALRAIWLDRLTAVLAVLASIALFAAVLMFTLFVVFGFLVLLGFIWPMIAADQEEFDRALSVMPGTGGWLLFAGTLASILQVMRNGRRGSRSASIVSNRPPE